MVGDDFLQHLPKPRTEIVALQAIGNVGGEKTQLVAAVIGGAFIDQAMEGLPRHQPYHGVGNLNLAAGPRCLRQDFIKDLGLQDIASGNDQV